jgi:hypothetical protein
MEQGLDLTRIPQGHATCKKSALAWKKKTGPERLGPEASWFTQPARRPRWMPGEDTPRPRSCLVETLSFGRVAKRVSKKQTSLQ